MEILIIISVLIFEVAFIAYSIKSENNHNRATSQVRIAAFITFVGLSLTPIIEGKRKKPYEMVS